MDRTVCVKVMGRGTFQNTPGLKSFVREMIQRGYRDFVVDLADCEVMDSTFMGTLAGAALRLREIRHGGLDVVNANPRNRDLLAGLGLDQLFGVHTDSGPHRVPEADRPVGPAEVSESARREQVLEAHENLARVDASNAVKFYDVIEYLKKEIASREGGAEGSSES